MKFLVEINDDEIFEQMLEDGDPENIQQAKSLNDLEYSDIYCYVSSLIGVYHSDYEVEIIEEG